MLVGPAGPLLQNGSVFVIVNHFYVLLLCLCLVEIQYRSLTSHCYICCSNRSILLQQSSFNFDLMKEQREKQRRRQREPEKRDGDNISLQLWQTWVFHIFADFEKSWLEYWIWIFAFSFHCVLVFATALQTPKTDTFSSLYFFFAVEAIR